ncbi:hypothetical protein GLE_2687 [Lysobacter enzymogenes]|uniref:Uncharacterized protein n=1 Tax=Lysobacter enzymogenes TaxID=69 RepID=A0A0S2DHV6_LYSEN|nr:hypothetical protein GLE_2687 [Lysobacter enzymogenes]
MPACPDRRRRRCIAVAACAAPTGASDAAPRLVGAAQAATAPMQTTAHLDPDRIRPPTRTPNPAAESQLPIPASGTIAPCPTAMPTR